MAGRGDRALARWAGRLHRRVSLRRRNFFKARAPSTMLRMVPLPHYRGGGCKRSHSRDAIRTRVIVTCTKQSHELLALRTDLRQRMPAVDAGTLTIRASSHECKKRRKGKRNADQRGSVSTALARGARFAKRARQSAFHHGPLPVGVFHPKAQPGPGFVTHAAHAAGPPPAGVAHPATHLARRS
jgi:hypothetical protein